MGNKEHKRSTKDTQRERALIAILSTVTVKEASRVSGISYQTLRRLLATESFQQELQQVKRQYLAAAVNELQVSALSAVRALRHVLELPHSSNLEKIASARAILDYCERYSVAENLESRIKALEQKAGTSYYDEQPQNVIEARTAVRESAESGWTRNAENLDSTGASSDNAGKPVEIRNSGSAGQQQPGASFSFVSNSGTGTQEQDILATAMPVLVIS